MTHQSIANSSKLNKADEFGWWDMIKSFIYLLGSTRKRYLFWLSFLFLIQFYSVIPPIIVASIIDFFTNHQSSDSLTPFYVAALILGGSFSIVSFIRLSLKRYLGNLQSDIVYEVRVEGFKKLLSQTLIQNRQETSGEKAQKIQNGIQAFRSISQKVNSDIFNSITTVIGILVVFLFLNITYVIFVLAYVLGFFLIVKFFYRRINQLNYEFNQAIEKSSGSYIEGLSNILTIKALGAQSSFGTHIAAKEELRRSFEYQIRRYGVGQWIAFQVFNGFCIAIFLLFVGRDVLAGAITLGSIVLFYGYLDQLTSSASQILSIYEDLIASKSAIARMMPIFWQTQHIQENSVAFPTKWNTIKLANASYAYVPDEQKVHDLVGVSKLNLTISKFDKIGIVGKTGSGKSTLAKLLIGLFPFDSGQYLIGKEGFDNINHEQALDNISLVLQETEMFNLSMRDNITLMKKVDLNLLDKAIKIAQLQEIIDKLPEGIDTLLGEKGYHLSGGERQRIGIARAICIDPQIFIFDEATSSLDSKTEILIQQAIENELNKKTIITIAHRISTLSNSDNIYVFEKGKIVEEGQYNQLIKDRSSKLSQFYYAQTKKV